MRTAVYYNELYRDLLVLMNLTVLLKNISELLRLDLELSREITEQHFLFL